MRKKYKLQEPIERDVYNLTAEERKKLNIQMLPGSLDEAISLAEKSELLRRTLGDHVFYNLIESKKVEWDNYRIQVHPYEIEKYFTNFMKKDFSEIKGTHCL